MRPTPQATNTSPPQSYQTGLGLRWQVTGGTASPHSSVAICKAEPGLCLLMAGINTNLAEGIP